MECINNLFNIDPTSKWYESIRYFDESYNYDNELVDMIKEATTDVNKKNVLQKLFDFIKKVIAWIVKAIKNIITRFKSLFAAKKQSADQIMSVTCDKSTEITPSVSDDKIVSIISIDDDGNESSIDYDVIAKDIFMIIKVNTNEIIFEWTGINNRPKSAAAEKLKLESDIAKKNGCGKGYQYHLFACLYLVDDNLTKFKNVVNGFVDSVNGKADINDVTKNNDELLIEINRSHMDTRMILTIDGLNKFYQEFVELNKLIADVDISSIPDKETSTYSKCLGSICDTLTIMQFAFNNITNSISRIYDVDAKYIGCCKNIDSLDIAVKSLINGGVPHNHVARNAYLLADEKLRKYSDINKPTRGQSRMVLFPEDDTIVYKVSVNALGISDNSREHNAYVIANKAGVDDVLIPSIDLCSNHCIQTMNRAISGSKAQKSSTFNEDFDNLQNKLKDLPARCGLKIKDVHDDNVGYLNNSKDLRVIDYGQVIRV